MRRLLACALALAIVPAGIARAGSIGVGAFGGMSYPVLQDDTGNGKLYGFCAPVKLVPMVTVEPFYASTALSDKVTTIAGLSYSRQGFEITAYGVNAMLATGGPVSFYPIVGVGQTRLKRDQFDQNFTTYNLGVGIGLSPIPKVTVHIRGQLQAVVDGSTSRKFGNATVGASYSLFGMP